MKLIIPHLFPSARFLETAAQDLRLPALETLLARGTLNPWVDEGVEATACKTLGIVRQQDWPLAPITLESDGGVAGDAYWLRADPVHLRLMRDRIVLADSSELNISPEEAEALTQTIGQHFGDTLRPLPMRPQRWYVRLPHPPHLVTTPLSLATGRAIDPLLPQGNDSRQFRALLNELQMLLFEHPVNQAREARGELAVNSLWLWGGGCKPAPPTTSMSVYACDQDVQALGRFCGANVHPHPARLKPALLETQDLVVLDELIPSGQRGDIFGWREAMHLLEACWFAPLLGTLRTLGSDGLHLIDPVKGKALLLRRQDAWKIWRRRKALISVLG